MAGIEGSVLGRQCLDERMDDPEYLKEPVAAWEQ
jgi:hypothetical protein